MNNVVTWIRQHRLPLLATLGVTALAWGCAGDFQALYARLNVERLPRSLLAMALFLAVAGLLALVWAWQPRRFASLQLLRSRLKALRWLLALVPAVLSAWFFMYTPWTDVFNGYWIRLSLQLLVLAVMAWLASASPQRAMEWKGLLAASVLLASLYGFAYELRSAVDYPFSLSWSEGNRLWDYSVLFGKERYIYPEARKIPAYIDLGRQSLWGLPFLLPGIGIQGVRLWSVLVFTLPYALLAWLFCSPRRLGWGAWLLLGLWAYVFLNQGPIYTPLVLAAALVALSRRLPPWVGFFLVGIAGYYARISRVTWMFAPAIWAVVVSLLETEPQGASLWKMNWKRALLLGLGGLLGGVAIPEGLPMLRAWLSGTQASGGVISAEGISSRLERQPLLWDRLWPNSTYAPGIVYGLLLATGAVMMLLLILAFTRRWRLNRWQALALCGSLLAFLGVGIVVSVKIGGGSNLHNLDMFLIGLLLAVLIAWERGAGEWLLGFSGRRLWLGLLVLFAVLYPAYGRILHGSILGAPVEKAPEALNDLRTAVASVQGQGDILFMDQRQLLTFGYIQGVPLVADYEKKLMMDQAMADNAAYFEKYYADLRSHRFALIISEPLWVKFQGDTYQFGNENDAWVKWVSIPTLCYYEPLGTNSVVGVQWLVPKEKSSPKKGVECP